MVHREGRRAAGPAAGLVLLLSTRLHLVRHGRAAAGWDADVDPGLDEVGRAQAADMATTLARDVSGARPVLSSPLRRCRETADVLAARWGVEPELEPRVAELPSPEGVPMGQRVAWLREASASTWTDLGPRYAAYRDDLVACLLAIPSSAVVVTHFFAINAAIGVATGDDRTRIRSLDNCSVTVIDVREGAMALVEGGHEADTLIR